MTTYHRGKRRAVARRQRGPVNQLITGLLLRASDTGASKCCLWWILTLERFLFRMCSIGADGFAFKESVRQLWQSKSKLCLNECCCSCLILGRTFQHFVCPQESFFLKKKLFYTDTHIYIYILPPYFYTLYSVYLYWVSHRRITIREHKEGGPFDSSQILTVPIQFITDLQFEIVLVLKSILDK